MNQWINYITENFGSMEDFNKLPYVFRYAEWEAFINKEE
jgi:hypothetical protein